MTARYALYAAPAPDDPLWAFGSSIIGYDAASGLDQAFPSHEPCNEPDWRELTEEPRRYGFHGTLKAPFALAEGQSEAAFLEAAMVFADRRPAFVVPALKVALLGSFCALIPSQPSDQLEALASTVVNVFEPFRAPLTPQDRVRRLKAPLTERQVSYLDRYGYPYVLDEFRYHMTLTGRLQEDRRDTICSALAKAYAPLDAPFRVDGLVVFHQVSRSDPFTILARFPFDG
jgi:putative phosphonate metabolism protein